jgi:Phosphotransferase enzyme family
VNATSSVTGPIVDEALEYVGLRRRGPISTLPGGPGRLRRTVLRVPVTHADGRRFAVVVKQVPSPRDEETYSLSWEHRVGRELHEVAEALRTRGEIGHNPLPAVLHERPLDVQAGPRAAGTGPNRSLVSIRTYVEAASAITPRTWGQLIGLLHVVGSTPTALALLCSRWPNALFGLDVEHLLRAVRSPGHPYQPDTEVLQRVAGALRERVARAIDADPVPLLVHRDLHPLNIVIGREGPVALDWAEAGWGNRSDDFAWLHVAVTRFGAPRSVVDDARAGYEDVLPGKCPSNDQIRTAGQVRELICLAFSIQNAGISPSHLQEAQVELAILDNPDAVTPPWTPLFNRAAFAHPSLGCDVQR